MLLIEDSSDSEEACVTSVTNSLILVYSSASRKEFSDSILEQEAYKTFNLLSRRRNGKKLRLYLNGNPQAHLCKNLCISIFQDAVTIRVCSNKRSRLLWQRNSLFLA